MRRIAFIIICLSSLAASAQVGGGGKSVVDTRHNLSVSGPGAVRAAAEQEICIFCHTPHNASPVQPLWNRLLPVAAYTVYSSNSLNALPGQPTGSSKLCLSCHDGTIALGSVVSRDQPIPMAGGITTIPPGAGNLGTDLSDDHPISFRYDASLVTADPKLKDPAALPQAVRLDANRELQCTSCHDAHDDSKGKFLVMHNQNSQLCSACHQPGTTQINEHQTCVSCHKMHSAPSGPLLLQGTNVRATCITCHDATGGPTGQAVNIAQDLNKFSMHDTDSPVDLADHIPNHVGCSDCHQPHTMGTGVANAPDVPANFGQINGVNTAGSPVARANFEYEVCFKCHADQAAVEPIISRQLVQSNTRLEFSPSAISFHPVTAAGKSSDVPSLKPGLTTASIIGCTDCHNSDTGAKAGGGGPDGVHGSSRSPLLVARYDTQDNSRESAQAYALCYRCHQRNTIIGDGPLKKVHKKHLLDADAPCSACHDAHGIASAQGTNMRNSHLINFDITIVSADTKTGRLEYNRTGPQRGQRYLTCHGKKHSPKEYGD